MPYYREALLSAWPDLVFDIGAPPPKLDPQFLSTLKPTEFSLYGRNARGLRRNQWENTRIQEKDATSGIQAPKFLSERARESANATPGISEPTESADDISKTMGKMKIDGSKADVPAMYRAVEIKYSKFGVDDFDFG
jgi:PAB-dependent poly(A)-specific ribonuclease subunit 2